MENKIFGYVRVSTREQNVERQTEALKNFGIQERLIFIDRVSGKDFKRPRYNLLKMALRENDLLVVKSIDRLGRNYSDILKEWREITKDIKANIKILDMPLLDTTVNNNDLTGTFISDIVLQILSYVAETERNNIKQRQKEGIEARKAAGLPTGRKKIEVPLDFDSTYLRWKNKDITAKKAMELLELKRSTFYKMVSEYEQ